MAKRRENKKTFQVVGQDQEQAETPSRKEEIHIPISFDAWWIVTASKYGFKAELKESIKKHFEAKGITDSRDFKAGLRDFGYNV